MEKIEAGQKAGIFSTLKIKQKKQVN